MNLFCYDKNLKRVWILGKRIHHGAVGFAMFVGGVALMKNDWHDFPWLRDND
jgi:hypothetical protein